VLQEVRAMAAYLTGPLGLTRGSFVGTFLQQQRQPGCPGACLLLQRPGHCAAVRHLGPGGLQPHSAGDAAQRGAFCARTSRAATVSELGSAEQAIRLIVAEPFGGGSSRPHPVELEQLGPLTSATCRWRTSWSECCQLFAFAHGPVQWRFFRGDRAGPSWTTCASCQPTFMAAQPPAVAASGLNKDTLWDRLVFRRVQEGLGGRVRFVAVGGAPISADTLNFVKAALGCPVVQGFGQTETCGLGLCQRPGDPASNHTGRPMLGIEVRLADAPDADCPNAEADGRGEFRSARPRLLTPTAGVHTGDIAQLLPGGSYRIVDRVKHLFKLAQGEYIAPREDRAGVLPEPGHRSASAPACSAFVVPTLDAAKAWLAKNSADTAAAAGDSPPELLAAACGSAGFKAHLLGELQQLGKQKGLQSFEQVKAILLHPEPFSAENDLMTPTMKLKRPQLRKRFADAFDAMYAEVEP
uniref:long-chain-fatty-acid--CoA ligase n=1 Tax=Macrostomum lignano TaxID=282301 RepID=A0A1I8F6Z3_9PLAT